MRIMDPITTLTTTWTVAKTAGEISKRLYELGKGLKDREAKQHVDEILDKLRELKQSASELEDQNRDLREKLRFKSEDFEFRNPFWYEQGKQEPALCPVCFTKNIAAPMGLPGYACTDNYRRCLACGNVQQFRPDSPESEVQYDLD